MIIVVLDFHYKSWLPTCTSHPYSCVSMLPLYNRKANELRLLLPVRGLTLRNSPLIGRVRTGGYQTNPSLVQTMALRLVGSMPLPELMLEIVNWTLRKKHQWIFIDISIQHSRKCVWTCHLRNSGHFSLGLNVLGYWSGNYMHICHSVNTPWHITMLYVQC